MREQPNAKQRILQALKEAKTNGITPVGIEVPADIEEDLALVPLAELGSDLQSDFEAYGVRQAVDRRGGKLFGYKVVWDAVKLKII